MLLLKVFEVIFVFCVDIAPITVPFVDASIQIWNSVTINDIAFVKNQEWTGDPPASERRRRRDTFDSNRTEVTSDLKGGFSNVREAFINFNISENVQIELTGETVISIALLQLPALFLACFGIFEAFRKHEHGYSVQTLKGVLHATILIAIPFFLVELFSVFLFEASLIVHVIVEKLKFVLDLKCGACMDGFMQKLDFLHFLPSKESSKRDKMLCLEVVKVFFGTCFQLCFQMVLYLGYTQPQEVEYSQIFSIISSFLLISKLGVDIVRFKRNAERQESTPNETLQFWEKINNCVKEILQLFNQETIKRVFFYVLLLFTSVACNSGTLIMAILVWNEKSLIYIVTVFAVNILVSVLLPYAFLWVEKCEHFLGLQYKYERINHGQTIIAAKKKVQGRFMRGIFVSWSNIFFLSRPIEDSSYYRTIHMVLVQIARSPINFGTLFGLIFYTLEGSSFAESLKSRLLRWAILLIFVQIANILIVLRYTYHLNGCSESANVDSIDLPESMPLTQNGIENNNSNVKNDSSNDETSTNKNDETMVIIMDESNLSRTDESESEDTDKEPVNKAGKKYVNDTGKDSTQETFLLGHSNDKHRNEIKTPSQEDIPILEKVHILSGTLDWSSAIEETDIELLAYQSNLQNKYEITEFKKLLNNGMEGGFEKDVVDELFMFYPNLDVKSLKKHTIFKVFEENENARIETSKLMLLMYALLNKTPEELLRNIFMLVDKNNDGKITKETFKAVVSDIFVLLNETKITDSITEQLVKNIFDDIDAKHGGKIDLNEFLKVCSEHNYIVINRIKEFQSRYSKI